MPDRDALLRLAIDAAEGAGALLQGAVHDARTSVEHKSSATDMVTEMDQAAEAFIVSTVRAARPDDGVLGEEGSNEAGTSGVRWIIDPLDGTTNYVYGFPAYAVSVAVEVDGEVAVAAVHDPSHSETFTAIRGRGAWCNGRRLHVGGPPAVATALVATGFSYLPERRAWQADVVARLMSAVRDIRRAGAASLDLCWVAAGRVDIFFERGLQPWDYSAGALIASEAGAVVGDLEGGPPSSDIVVATPPSIDTAFRDLLTDAEAAADPTPRTAG
ncbi:MAG: monophosphatase [Actinomycetota bacterium]|nr:monophosphatase [Actinomycetota bacterium]